MSLNKKPKTINPDEVDPSVYYYDEVYDDMKDDESSHQRKQDDSKKTKQGSKYIQGIIETADRRKSEKEIRKFRKYARDREEAEANGELDGSDVYVSKTYEKKLREMREAFKKQSKPDEDLELNSFKKHKIDKGDDKTHSRKEPREKNTTETDCDTNNYDTATQSATEWQDPTKRKRPKTIEERKEYLRHVLKKQTVGELFDAAVKRFNERKALRS